jgi:quinolinate synthase
MKNTDLVDEIAALKKEKNAIVLAHNYQLPEVQDIADYVADSLGLARKAAVSDADVIVLCGVKFMAESASILCPNKTVLMPDLDAGCPMANMITPEDVLKLKEEHPGAPVVAYVNTSADVKAEVDVCCTSSNAVKIVKGINSKEIIFIPDKYLGSFVAEQTGKDLVLWNGFCPTHARIQPEDIMAEKEKHPQAKVLVHPECTPQVIELADEALSTGGMLEYARKSNAKEFIIGTEVGILHQLNKQNPRKSFYPASKLATCPNMKKTTLPKVLSCLKNMEYEVKVPEDIRKRALRAIERMVEV